MKIDIITIFPEMIRPYLEGSMLKRGQDIGVIKLAAHNLRDWADDKHSTTDDTPYGGGAGMVMKVEPIHKAVESMKSASTRVVLTSASGRKFTQEDARRLATNYDHVVFICGRYEGVDGRIEEHVADEVFSIGDYVLTGGELPALVMADAIVRNVPGVLGNEKTLADESHDEPGKLEYPQYTKPEEYNGWKVPEVLTSGNHAAIDQWREENRKGSREGEQ